MRIRLNSGKQKELIFLAKSNGSWNDLAKKLKVNSIYLSNELRNEKRLLAEETYAKLCRLGHVNFDNEIISKFDNNWGRSKGGYKSIKKVKEIFRPKRDEKLAEVFGIILGDGHLSEFKQGKKVRVYCVRIAGNSKTDKEYILKYIPSLFKKVFHERGSCMQGKKTNCAYFTIYGKEIVEFLKENGLKAGNKVKNNVGIPKWIKENPSFLKSCVKGLTDTDGCVYYISKKTNRNLRITFTNHASNLLNDYRAALIQLGFSPSKIVRGYDVFISRKSDVQKYISEVGFANSKNLKRIKYFSSDR